jgi:hypothetical protein
MTRWPTDRGVDGKVKRKMYTKALKAQVEHDMYVVDVHLVAEALLRRAAAPRAVNRRGARARAAGDQSPRPQA